MTSLIGTRSTFEDSISRQPFQYEHVRREIATDNEPFAPEIEQVIDRADPAPRRKRGGERGRAQKRGQEKGRVAARGRRRGKSAAAKSDQA